MAFLIDQDYEDLPEDDGEAFVKLESLARGRLHHTLDPDEGRFDYEETLRYMNEVSALAHQLEIPDLIYDYEADNIRVEFARFTRAVDYRLTQIKLQRSRRDRRNSVAITGSARERIQHHLERLKDEIISSDIPEKRKRSLLDKIAEFEAELSKPRVNLAAIMTVVALVSSVVHDNAETLLEGPKIIQTISALFGHAQSEEADTAPRLAASAPFKAIPDLRQSKNSSQQQTRKSVAFDDDLTDDVPF